jgi:hypothetical protein
MIKNDNDTIPNPKIHIKNHFVSSTKSFGAILYGKRENKNRGFSVNDCFCSQFQTHIMR